MPKCSAPTFCTRGWRTPRGLATSRSKRRVRWCFRERTVAMRIASEKKDRAHPIFSNRQSGKSFFQQNPHTRGQAPFAGTALRVLRTKGACPLFGRNIMPTNPPLHRKLRMGLVGGGQGAFIGRVHATAAILDNRAALVAGALSADPAKAKASAPDYDITPDRAYGSYKEMAEQEAKRPDKIDFVSVATPNHTHFEIAKTFAEAGFNVICYKPLTFDFKQAENLA